MAAGSSRHIEPLLPLIQQKSGTDTGSGSAETTTLVITPPADANGATTEATLLVITAPDTGTGSEDRTLTATSSSADTGTGADVATVSVSSTDTNQPGSPYDDFSAALDTRWSTYTSDGAWTVAATGGKFRVSTTGGPVNGYAGAETTFKYDLRSVTVEATFSTLPPATSGDYMSFYWAVDSTHKVEFLYVAGAALPFRARVFDGSSTATVLYTLSGPPRHFRFRGDTSGTICFEYSSDGATWTLPTIGSYNVSWLAPGVVGLYAESDPGGVAFNTEFDDLIVGLDGAALAAALTGTDTGAGTDAQTLVLQVSDTDTNSTTTEATDILEGSADAGTGADAESLAAALSSSDQNRTSRTELDAGVAVDTVGAQKRSDADTGVGADGSPGQVVSTPDAGAGADAQVLSKIDSSTDTGAGVDTEVVSSQKLTSTDAGAGADAQALRQWFVVQDAGRGETDFTTPVDLDTAAGTDLAAVTGFPGFDTGTGADTQSLSVSASTFLTDTDSGVSYDGNVDPLYAGPLFWWGAELSAVTVTPAAETNTAVEVEALRAIAVAAVETGTAAETATVTTATTDVFVNDTDLGAGLDAESHVTNGIIGDSDTGSATEEITDRALADTDANTAVTEDTTTQPLDDDGGDYATADDQETLLLASLDAAVGADEQLVVVTDTDTAAGTEQTSPAPPTDRDSIVVAETVNLAQVTGDTGGAVELTQLAAVQTFSAQDFGFGADAGEHIYIVLTDTGTGTEATGNRNVADLDILQVVETTSQSVVGLVGVDTGRGHSFASVGLPTGPASNGTLTLARDDPGVLTVAGNGKGALTLTPDTPGGLTITAKPGATLVLTPIGDTQE